MNRDGIARRRSLKLAGAALASLVLKGVNADEADTDGERVVVIGSGVSGLAAARTLADAGMDVRVLEARDRIGGRVWTSEQWRDAPMDMGASWIHESEGNPITRLAKKAGCRLVASHYDNALVLNSDGKSLTSVQEKRLATITDEIESAVLDAQDQDDDQSLMSAIKEHFDWETLSAEDRKLASFVLTGAVDTQYGEHSSKQSAHWFDDGDAFAGDDMLFPDGYKAIPKFLSAGINVLFNQVVRRITWGAEGVSVTTDKSGFDADRIVVTLPLGVLKSGKVVFEPPLPANKRNAIESLGMGVLNKCYLRFPSVFWPKQYDWLEYIPPSGSRWVEWFSLAKPTGKPIILGFNASDAGREMEKWSDQETVASAMETLRKMFGASVPNPTAFQITRWNADPFSLGSYSYNAVGSTPKMRLQLAKPLSNRVFFAGEATSREYFGTVHGAYLSGVRAAKEVLLAAE